MKAASESNPWVPIVAGVLCLLAAGIAFRQCGSSTPPDSVTGSQLAARASRGPVTGANNQPAGWIAQSAPESVGAEHRRLGTESGRRADNGSTDTRDRGTEPDDSATRRDSIGSRRAAEPDFRDTDTTDDLGDAIPVPQQAPQAHLPRGSDPAAGNTAAGNPAGSNPATNDAAANGNVRPAAAQDQPAKANADKPAAPATQEIAQANDPVKAGGPEDGGPALSLPLDNSLTPDKGSDTAPIIASGLTFDINGAHFSNDAQLLIPSDGNVNPEAGTFTFWILPIDWAGDTESVLQILHLGATTWANRFDIFKDHVYLRLLMCPDSGYESGAGANISNWKNGDRHMIAATWGDGVVDMYIDGASVGANDYDGQLDIGTSPPLFLGSGNPRVPIGANSNITNFQMYTRALGADEVAALFDQPPS